MDEQRIQNEIRTMYSRFSRLASDHFKTTKPLSYTEFEGGTYGFFYAKPSRRVRHVLSVDREILVLLTSFTDQQQRTVRVARQLVDESEGRLEVSISVVVHKDPEGNRKLIRWGRDSGSTILPLFLGGPAVVEHDFERVFFADLFAQDPFDVRGPVSDDANFFGRRDEAQELARKLGHGHIRSLLAIRKIGKTSVINRTIDLVRAEHTSLVVMLDCSIDGIWNSDARGLLDAIARTLEQMVADSRDYSSVVEPRGDAMQLDESVVRLQSAILRSARPVILVLDEIDYITPGSTAPTQSWKTQFNPFWRNLRAVFQEAPRQGAKLSLLVAGVSSKWFSVESVNGEENAALAFIPEEYLRPLARGATLAMIRRLGSRAGLSFTEPCAELIAEATGDVPYWTRMACSFIHRHSSVDARPVELEVQAVEGLVGQFIEQEGAAIAEVALRHLFRVFPELTSACIAASHGETADPYLIGVLAKYGIVEPRTGLLRGDMTRAGLALHLEKQTALGGAQTESPPPPQDAVNELDQWAEELAIIGRRRNLLEKRLRALVVNSLKLDSLQNPSKAKAKDRILAIRPEKERGKMLALSAEQAVDKLTWIELVTLVKKEWGLVGAIFGDQVKFEQCCDVVNDRFDAHAKSADLADMALYRRDLTWLEDRLSLLG
jgi:hypothetical protein